MEILAEFQPFDPVGGARVMLRACSGDDKRLTAIGGNRWVPAIMRRPALRHDWFDGDFTGAIRIGGASLTVAMYGLKRLNANAGRFQWAAAPVALYEVNPAVGTPTLIFKGVVNSYGAEDENLQLDLRVDTAPFEASALTATYAGTGGAEGGADIKGKVKPWCFGRAKNVEPILINAVDSVYQVSAYGRIQDITAVYERASMFGPATADFPDYASLVAATIPPGRWAACLNLGLIRLGAPAAGVITADVDGDFNGTWLRRTGEIITRICTNAGISTSLLDTASLAALDSAMTALCPTNQGRINLYLTEQIKIIDLVQTLARPCNAAAGISTTGQLFVTRTVIGTPGLTLDVQGRRLPPVAGAQEIAVSPPFARLQMGADRCWRVHRPDEISFYADIIEKGDYSGSTTYREGNIVVHQGARWIYTNPTPTSGNAPPTLPTTSNSFWSLLAGQTDFATITGATKPADMATPGDNLIINPDLATDSRDWDFAFGGARVAGTTSDPAPGFIRVGTFSGGRSFRSGRYPTSGSTRLFLSWQARKSAGATASFCNANLYFYDRAGALISTAGVNVTPAGSAVWNENSFWFTVPANTYNAAIQFDLSNPSGNFDFTKFRLSPMQRGADATAVNWAAGIQSGGTILQAGGAPVLAAAQPFEISVTDGQVLTWSLARSPQESFDLSGLPALAANESYSARLENKTASGATVRLKKRTSGGSPATLNSAAGTAITPDIEYQANKGDARDARDGVYNFTFTVTFDRGFSGNNGGAGGGGGDGVKEP